MGFDDLARHMKARDGGKLSGYTDPNLMMVEASERAQSSDRTSNLVLGPLLFVGGIVMLALMGLTSLNAYRQGAIVIWVAPWVLACIAVIGGAHKTWRGISGRD